MICYDLEGDSTQAGIEALRRQWAARILARGVLNRGRLRDLESAVGWQRLAAVLPDPAAARAYMEGLESGPARKELHPKPDPVTIARRLGLAMVPDHALALRHDAVEQLDTAFRHGWTFDAEPCGALRFLGYWDRKEARCCTRYARDSRLNAEQQGFKLP